MKSVSVNHPQPMSSPVADGQTDECSDEDTDTGEMDRNPLIDTAQFKDSPTRQLIKQEKKEKKKRRNKRIRKRIRRVLRVSWKWFRRGCAGLAPVANGIGMAFGPVIKPYSTNSSSVYGARA